MRIKFLVTGGAGFIGSMICEKLIEAGYIVCAFDDLSSGHLENLNEVINNDNFTFIKGDVRDYDLCLQITKGFDYVIHQAALVSVPKSIEKPLLNNEQNIDGFLNILEASRLNNVKRVIYASSSAIYGDNDDQVKTEDSVGKVISPYALSKYVDELYASLFTRLYGLETVGLRYFNVYGPKQDPSSVYSGVISIFFNRILKGQDLSIYGDGTNTRDFIFVEDVAKANILAALATNVKIGQAYNIGTGNETSIKELAETIIRINRACNRINYLEERKGDIKYSCANVSKAHQDFNFRSEISLEEGLKRISDYLKVRG